MPFSDENLKSCARKLSEILVRYQLVQAHDSLVKLMRQEMSDIVGSLVRSGDLKDSFKDMHRRYYQTKQNEYHALISSLFPPEDCEFKKKWMYVGKKGPLDPKSIFRIGSNYVNHKLYFTFKPTSTTHRKALLEIYCFVQQLPRLYEKLNLINRENQDYISFKVSETLSKLVTHADTLVIYFYKKQSHGPITCAVIDTFRAAGIELVERGILGTYGFDFHNEITREVKSHSQIIGDIVTKWMIQSMSELSRYGLLEFAHWLQLKIMQAKQLDIMTAYSIMDKPELEKDQFLVRLRERFKQN